jgi:CBS domain-containing protein
MTLDPAIARGLLRDLKDEANDPITLYRRGEAARTSWRSRLFAVVSQSLGPDSHIAKQLAEVHYSLFVITDSTPESAWERAFAGGVEKAVGLIEAADFELDLLSRPEVQLTHRTQTPDETPHPVVFPGRDAATKEVHAGEVVPDGSLALFHRIANVVPDGQVMLAVPTSMPVSQALQLMLENNFSQLPVVEGSTVLGAFSFRSFSRGSLDLVGDRVAPLDLTVDDFVERLTIADPTADLDSVLDALNDDGAVLVGRPDGLVGIVTGTDALLYVYGVAELFVQLQEIEQAVRAVIRYSMSDGELGEAIERSLRAFYAGREDKMPKHLLEMSFAEYASLIGDGRNWDAFEALLGTDRSRAKTRLDRVAELRNDVFHFRRELSDEDRRHLRTTREWLLRRLQVAAIRPDAQ